MWSNNTKRKINNWRTEFLKIVIEVSEYFGKSNILKWNSFDIIVVEYSYVLIVKEWLHMKRRWVKCEKELIWVCVLWNIYYLSINNIYIIVKF